MDQMENYVIDLLETYRDRERKINILHYNMEHPAKVDGTEQIEAMNYGRNDSAGHTKGHISNKTLYIAHNYDRPIKISDIGRTVGLHPDYANAIFKKAFGCTLSRYVAEERIGHVKRKLILTDMSITQIAFDCGFNSISRFNSTFLDICGQTPRHYREQNK